MAILDNYFLKDIALHNIKFAQKQYEKGTAAGYFVVLAGWMNGKLSLCPGDPHRYDMIIDAIHKYQKRHPNKKIKEGYTDAILMAIRGVSAKSGLAIIFDWLDYECEKQKNGTNTFTLDYKMLLEKLKAAVAESIDSYRAETPGFDMWFEERIEFIKQNDRRAR